MRFKVWDVVDYIGDYGIGEKNNRVIEYVHGNGYDLVWCDTVILEENLRFSKEPVPVNKFNEYEGSCFVPVENYSEAYHALLEKVADYFLGKG